MVCVSVIITAYERVEQTLATIRVIQSCKPAPAEILVHVDANRIECEEAIREDFQAFALFAAKHRLAQAAGETS